MTCDVPGCDRSRKTGCRLYCSAHQARLGKWGDVRADVPLRARVESQVCAVEGCERPTKPQSRGNGKHRYCAGHLSRLRAHGDLRVDVPLGGLSVGRPRIYSDTCAVEECGRPRHGRSSLCAGHRGRKERAGDVAAGVPFREFAPSGAGTVDVQGYHIDRRRGHPLAMSQSRLARHRAVLYEQLGPGEHPCRWCGRLVAWGTDLNVDHLDGNKLNNEARNLVAACSSCNAGRARAGNPPEWSPA